MKYSLKLTEQWANGFDERKRQKTKLVVSCYSVNELPDRVGCCTCCADIFQTGCRTSNWERTNDYTEEHLTTRNRHALGCCNGLSQWIQKKDRASAAAVKLRVKQLQSFKQLHCVQKKHPLTFSFISPWIICGFKQKLQWIYLRIDRFWQCKS